MPHELHNVKRTICIGLGGTGKNVLMQLRRLVVDRYGDLNKLPIVSFVHIDTDKGASGTPVLRTGNTYHGVDLSFRDAEKVSATMTSTEVSNFVRGLERRTDSDRPGPYDHISRWFPPQLLRNIKAVEDGAKGIRPVGRLAFFHNYRQIRAAIATAEQRTRGHEATLLQQERLRVEPGLNIFVIGSLCGGTGSGMFLDLAYSLRKAYGDQSAQILGYLVTSPQLYGNTGNMNANTYAALKELNHYTTPGIKFEACYDMQELVWVQEPRPPFDYTYLISNQTAGEYVILEQRKLCNVIAHKIALEFSSELAREVSSMRDNFLLDLIGWDLHPRRNSQGYLTFGLAAIYFPRDRTVQVALNKISLKLLKFWLNGEGQSPNPNQLVEQFLINHNWRDGLTARLTEAAQESNKTFSQTIKTWKKKLERSIDECKSKDDRLAVRQQLPGKIRQQFHKVQPGNTENDRGVWLTKLQQARPKITEQFKQNINQFFVALLTPSNDNFSVKSSREWLTAISTELNTYQRDLEEQIRNSDGSYTLDSIENKWKEAEDAIEEIERKFEMPWISKKNSQVQAEAMQVVRQICELIKHNFDLVANQEALKIINELQQYVQELSTQVTSFSRLVDSLKGKYEKEQQELKQLNFDEMSGEAIFNDEDIDECCEMLLPENEFRSRLVLVSSEITEPFGQGQSLANLIEHDPRSVSFATYRITEEELQAQTYRTVDRLFGSRSANIVNSVIKRFLQNYSGSERSIRLGQIMQEAEPLLRLNQSDPYFADDRKLQKIIGFKDTDEIEVKQFREILRSDLAIPDDQIKPTQAEEEILIITEYGGFPLRLLNGLEEMRKPYTRANQSDQSFLHNEPQAKFTDIIPPDARTLERLEDIFYPCLALELLVKNPETQLLEFQYYDQMRGRYQIASLSSIWNQALEKLANEPDMSETLQKILNREIAEIKRQPSYWQEYYFPKIQDFVNKVDELPEEDPNYPYQKTVTGIKAGVNTLGEEGVLSRFCRKMEQALRQLDQKPIPPSEARGNIEPAVMDADYTDGSSADK